MTYRVLSVEDDEDQQLLVRMALDRVPDFAIVGEAADEQTAIRLAAELHPSVVLLDVMLHGVDASGSIDALRAASPGCKVILRSALPREELRFITGARGATGFIEKHLSPLALPGEVRALVGVLDAVDQGLRLSADPTGPARARSFVSSALKDAEPDMLEIVQLLVSEVVTNAVVHAGSDVDVRVVLHPNVVRVEVHDESSAPVVPRAAGAEDVSGRGTELLDALARAWGTTPGDKGKTIWFEVARPHEARLP